MMIYTHLLLCLSFHWYDHMGPHSNHLAKWPHEVGLIPNQHLILELGQHEFLFPTSKFNLWSDHESFSQVRSHSKSYDNTSHTSKAPSIQLTDNARFDYQFFLVLLLFVIVIKIVRLAVYVVFPLKNCSHFGFWPYLGPFHLDGQMLRAAIPISEGITSKS